MSCNYLSVSSRRSLRFQLNDEKRGTRTEYEKRRTALTLDLLLKAPSACEISGKGSFQRTDKKMYTTMLVKNLILLEAAGISANVHTDGFQRVRNNHLKFCNFCRNLSFKTEIGQRVHSLDGFMETFKDLVRVTRRA